MTFLLDIFLPADMCLPSPYVTSWLSVIPSIGLGLHMDSYIILFGLIGIIWNEAGSIICDLHLVLKLYISH